MEESEDNLSTDDINHRKGPKLSNRPKKRSLVERELETNLTARITSPLLYGDGCSTSRYGRARRRLNDIPDTERTVKTHRSPKTEKSPKPTMQSPVYKMHASNSPIKPENLDNHIENIYTENISLSRFGSVEKKKSPTKRYPKVYIRKDLIQTKDKDKEPEETVMLIKNMFSPAKSTNKSSRNSIDRSSEKYGRKRSLIDTSSVVKTLDFDEKKVEKEIDKKVSIPNSETFDLERHSEYQVGDLAWARMGKYPFWPCIITREPNSGLFVKKKLFGRTLHNILNVTFFGDNGRRSWIMDSMLRPFLGQLEFETARSQFTAEAKKKDSKLYMAYFISKKKMPQWLVSVEEAEMLLREPKSIRIDILSDMLVRVKGEKITPKLEKSKRVIRTDSDVSLSESLFDTLFSDEDAKGVDTERSKNKIKNKSLDVSDVVTACLDNMAAKTGITKIQRQSHMDRWLLKAKTKTPDKSHVKTQVVQKIAPNSAKVKRLPKLSLSRKPYAFRKRHNESQKSENLSVKDNNHGATSNISLPIDCTSDSIQNFESSVTECPNLIDSKHDTEIMSANDSILINPVNDFTEDIVTETSHIGNDDFNDNKNVLGDLKHSTDIESNIPCLSENVASGISTSEISKLDTQTYDTEMIIKTTDESHSFLGPTEDMDISQTDGETSKDKFYQSMLISSISNEKFKNIISDSLKETLGLHIEENLKNITDISKNIDINTKGHCVHIDTTQDDYTVNNTKKGNIEKDTSHIAFIKVLEEENNEIKYCSNKDDIINENIPNISNNENITVDNEINYSECHKPETEIMSANDSILINPVNYLTEDIVTETCHINGNDDFIDDKNVLGDLKHSMDIESNIPSSSENVASGISTLEISKLDTQTYDTEMIIITTDKSHSFLGPTEDMDISQTDGNTSKNKFYQSMLISSIPNEKIINIISDSLTGENLRNITDISENIDINTKGHCIHIDTRQDDYTVNNTKKDNIEKDTSHIASIEVLEEENNEIKYCSYKDDTNNENIPNISNNENVTVDNEINDSECHKPETDMKCDSDLEKTSVKENDNMSIDVHMLEKQDCNIDENTTTNSSCISTCYRENEKYNKTKEKNSSVNNYFSQSESISNMLPKGESNIDNSVSIVDEMSKNISNFLTYKIFKTRNRNKDKKTVHNDQHDLTDKKDTCKAEESVENRSKGINHQVSEVETNHLEKPDINCQTDAEKSNNDKIVKALLVQSEDNVDKNNILSISIDKNLNIRDLARNKISNNELKEVKLITLKSMNSYDANQHDEKKLCLGQWTDINSEQKNVNMQLINIMKESSKGAETLMLNSETYNSVNTHLNQQNTVERCNHEPNPEILSQSLKNNVKQDDLVNNITEPILANYNLIENESLNALVLSHCNKGNENEEAAILLKNNKLSKNKKENNLKNDYTKNIICNDPEFQKYLELKQDSVMEEHPELSQEEITSYLYKTWLYGSIKSDKKVSDQISLVRGTNYKALDKDRGRRKLTRKTHGDFKTFKTLQPSTSNTVRTLNGYYQENRVNYSKKHAIDRIKITPSEKKIHDTTQDNNIENHATVANDLHLDKFSSKFDECPMLTSQTENDALDTPQNKADVISTDSDCIATTIENTVKSVSPTETQDLQKNEILLYKQPENIDTKPSPILEDVEHKLNNLKNVVTNIVLNDDHKKHIIEEIENINSEESISLKITEIASNDSEDKIKRNNINKSYVEKSMQDPDFLKYLGFKQDSVIDEHPELSQDEVVSYLHQTWIYEHNNKPDKKKCDEVDQTSLVKGANNTKIDRGRRRLSRKKPDDLKLMKIKQTPTIMNQLIIQNDYNEKHDLSKTLNIKENDVHMFPSKNTIVTRNKNSQITKKAIIRNKKAIVENKSTLNKEIVIAGEEESFVQEDISQTKENIDISDKKNCVQKKSIQDKEIEEGESFVQSENIEIKENANVSDGKNMECMQNNNDNIPSSDEPTLDNNLCETKENFRDVENSSQRECIKKKENVVVGDDKSTDQNESTQIIENSANSEGMTAQNECIQKENGHISCEKTLFDDNKIDQIKKNAVINVKANFAQDDCTEQTYNVFVSEKNTFDQIESTQTEENVVSDINTQNECVQMNNNSSAGDEIMFAQIESTKTVENSVISECTQNNKSDESLVQNVNFQTNENAGITVAENECTHINDDSVGSVEMQHEPTHSKDNVIPSIEHTEQIHDAQQDDIDFAPKAREAFSASLSVADSEEIHVEDENNYKEETSKDDDSASITSADSEMSLSRRRQRWKEKQMQDEKKKSITEPEFLRYLELRQDSVMDEHPELTEEEITNYLYKTWLYEENLKIDKKRTDEVDQTSLVKGVDKDANIKKVRRKFKVIKEDSEESFKVADVRDVSPKEKSKRSIVRPYYNEEFSDVEEMTLFEIFRTKKNSTKSGVEDLATTSQTQEISSVSTTEESNAIEEETVANRINLVEMYFEQLTTPKPNLFKGLVRERVCEICEKVGKLVKCKTCHCMFHVDCVKNPKKTTEDHTPGKSKKRGRKPKGRKSKNSEDIMLDSESHSDEITQDISTSDLNMSIENEREPIVADAEDFEAKASAKMKEILGDLDKIEYDYEISKVAIPWNTSEPGKCQIVNVKLQDKRQEEVVDTSNFKCNNCEKFETPICFVCKSPVSPKNNTEHRQKCEVAQCYKYYHLECLNHWPQTQFNGGESKYNKKSNEYFEAMSCPRHVCHTCVSDDPRGCRTRFSADKLAKCVRCPATYHSFTKCLPAGSQVLTGSHIICPRHCEHRPGKVPCHVNTGWCFICALGGTLICCEYCPTSFHAECLNIDPPEGGYMCEDCETGRLPLYGEMVWVKLGHYRWWPGIILHPSQIPRNILAVKHSPGEFVVRFFGQYDHYWVNRGRVFPFQEGDTGKLSNQRSKIDAAFSLAVEHASRACEILKTATPDEDEQRNIAASLLPPHYIRLKVNRPARGLRRETPSSLTQCDCAPDEPQPCGPHSQCLNRMLLTECGPTCRAGERCNNRAFERREYPRLEPYRTAGRGWGLRSLEPIAAGQFVIEYVGEIVDGREFMRRMRRKHEVRDQNFYFLTLDKERMIDAGPKGNLARFMNHSCEPNCETQKWTVLGDVRVGLFALYDIPANSELTFNYNLECAGIEKKPCMCGAKRCSGYIGVKPKQSDPEPKKAKPDGRKHRKRKRVEVPAPKKPKQRPGRPPRVRELTDIEKDLLIIRGATSPGDGRLPGDGSLTSERSPHVDNSPPRDKSLPRDESLSRDESLPRDESLSVDRSAPMDKGLPLDRGLKRAREHEELTVCLKRIKTGWSVG